MARLYRPAIPLEVKCRVLLRQLGEAFPDDAIEANRFRPGDAYLKGHGVFVPRGLGDYHERLMERLSELLNCKPDELRLDHDPPLALRDRTGEGKRTTYKPAANDPEHLAYRPHGTEHEGSHDVKTRIRGDHGQYSDIVLIKRKRRRERKAAEAKLRNKRPQWKVARKAIRSRWPKRKFPKKEKNP